LRIYILFVGEKKKKKEKKTRNKKKKKKKKKKQKNTQKKKKPKKKKKKTRPSFGSKKMGVDGGVQVFFVLFCFAFSFHPFINS
jgi:Flp pilus assembly protein TadB